MFTKLPQESYRTRNEKIVYQQETELLSRPDWFAFGNGILVIASPSKEPMEYTNFASTLDLDIGFITV